MAKLIHTDPVLSRMMQALREVFKKRGIVRKGEMADFLGYKGPYFSGVINGRERLTDSFLNNIEKKLGISSEWVATGEGSMYLKAQPATEERGWMVPLIPLYAHAGSLTNFAPSADDDDCVEYLPSPIRDAEYAITVTGDSMAPDFPNGTIVLIKKIEDKAFIEWGKAYVIDTCNGIVIKILAPSDKEGYVQCRSINPAPAYAPFNISKSDIYAIYAIKFSMTRR